MLKFGKFGLAFALALVMSLTLLTSGTFAQSTKADQNHSVRVVTVATAPQIAQQTFQATTQRQATQKLYWGPRRGWGGGGWGWRRSGWRGGWGWRRGWGWRGGWGWRRWGWGGRWGWGWHHRVYYRGCGC